MTTYFKEKAFRSKKATQSAKGERCTLQTPYCNNDPSTVVFCHAPCEDKGTSIKSPDFWGAHGCSSCHDYLDGRYTVKPTDEEQIFYWFRGNYRTLKRQFNNGVFR